jgi:hypothetical protein
MRRSQADVGLDRLQLASLTKDVNRVN